MIFVSRPQAPQLVEVWTSLWSQVVECSDLHFHNLWCGNECVVSVCRKCQYSLIPPGAREIPGPYADRFAIRQ